jgi:ADP-heptose:LPS heptosyltransferase
MHITAADVPIIAIFGQTNLKRYHPYMDDSRFVAIKKDHSVCPYFSFEHPRQECRRYDCNGNNCMDAITVNEVKEAVKKLVSPQSRRVLVQL